MIEYHLVSTATLYSVQRKPYSDLSIKVSSIRKKLSLGWMSVLREVHKVSLELSFENQSCHTEMDIKRYNPENVPFFLTAWEGKEVKCLFYWGHSLFHKIYSNLIHNQYIHQRIHIIILYTHLHLLCKIVFEIFSWPSLNSV